MEFPVTISQGPKVASSHPQMGSIYSRTSIWAGSSTERHSSLLTVVKWMRTFWRQWRSTSHNRNGSWINNSTQRVDILLTQHHHKNWRQILMAPSSGQPLYSGILILTTLQPNSTTPTLQASYTTTNDTSFKSASHKVLVQGFVLRQPQSHHTVSSGPTTGVLSRKAEKKSRKFVLNQRG